MYHTSKITQKNGSFSCFFMKRWEITSILSVFSIISQIALLVDAANVQLMICGLWVYLPLVDELKMRKQDYFQRGEDGTFLPLASFLEGR